jgi:hypothetical protein
MAQSVAMHERSALAAAKLYERDCHRLLQELLAYSLAVAPVTAPGTGSDALRRLGVRASLHCLSLPGATCNGLQQAVPWRMWRSADSGQIVVKHVTCRCGLPAAPAAQQVLARHLWRKTRTMRSPRRLACRRASHAHV